MEKIYIDEPKTCASDFSLACTKSVVSYGEMICSDIVSVDGCLKKKKKKMKRKCFSVLISFFNDILILLLNLLIKFNFLKKKKKKLRFSYYIRILLQ